MTSERGSGTVWVLALSMVLGLATVAGGAWGVAATARHRAEIAADLAALAAAAEVAGDSDQACAAAARIASENGAQLVRCQFVDHVAEVEVRRPLHIGGLHRWTAIASARAGPVPGGEQW